MRLVALDHSSLEPRACGNAVRAERVRHERWPTPSLFRTALPDGVDEKICAIDVGVCRVKRFRELR